MNKELVIVPTHTYDISSDYAAFGPALQNFVEKGGAVLFLAQDSTQSKAIFNTQLFSGTFQHFLKENNYKTVNSQKHAITNSWPYTSWPYGNIGGYNITNSDKIVFQSTRNYANEYGEAGIIRNIGLGHAIIIGFDYSHYTDLQSKELYNLYDWLHKRDSWLLPNWCFFNQDSATASTGDSLSFPIILNATKTNQQIHNYEVPIMTNDHKMEAIKVPVQMVVRFDNDLKIDTILGTETGCALNTIWVKAVVSNLGQNNVPKYNLFYQINKSKAVSQEVSKIISMGTKDTISFAVPYNSKGTGNQDIVVWVNTRGDVVYNNDTAFKTIISYDLPKVLIKPEIPKSIFCWSDDSLRLNASPAGLIFKWSNGSTADYIRVKFSGVTTLTGTDNKGCSNIYKFGTIFNTTPPATLSISGTHLICNNDSILISLNQESSYRNYVWTVGSENKNAIYAKDSGLYSVIVTDSNNCKVQSDTIKITRDFKAKPIIETDKKDPICDGEMANIWITTGKYAKYIWTYGDTTSAINVTKTSAHTCYVVTDSGCSYTSNKISIQVKSNPVPRLKSIANKEVCYGDSITISTTSPFYFYLWSDGSYKAEMLAKTTGRYFVKVLGDNRCSATSDTVDITFRNQVKPTIVAIDSTICENETTVISLDTGYAKMKWNSGDSAHSIITNKAGKFNVCVKDDFGCIGFSNTVEINQLKNPKPSLFFGGDTTFCEGTSQIVSIMGSYEAYIWNDSSVNQDITVDTSILIYADAADKNGCWGRTDSLKFNIEKYPRVNVQLSKDTICKGETVTASATNGYDKYNWGYSFPDNDTITLNISGTYYLKVFSPKGCTKEIDSFTIYDFPRPNAAFTHTAIEKTFSGINISNHASNYSWFVNEVLQSTSKDFSFNADSTGKYLLKLLATNRCYSDSVEAEVYLSTLGVIQHKMVKSFNVWPNPVKSVIHIVLVTDLTQNMGLQLYDARGSLLVERINSTFSNTLKEDLDLSSFAEGTYWLVVKSGEQIVGMKQVIK